MRMDKNTLIGWLLMAAVLFGFSWYSNRNNAKMAVEYQKQDSIAKIEKAKELKVKEQEATKKAQKLIQELADTTNVLFEARSIKAPSQEPVIENNLLRVEFSSRGAEIAKVTLKDETYKNQEGGLVSLFNNGDSEMKFTLDGKEFNIDSKDFVWNVTAASADEVEYSLPIGKGRLIMTYTLPDDTYIVKMNLRAEGMNGYLPSNTKSINMVWTEKMVQQEKGYDFETRYSTITYRDIKEDTHELSSMGGDEEEDEFENNIKWIAYKTQFFSQVLIADKSMNVSKMSSEALAKHSGYLKTLTTEMTADFDPTGKNATNFSLYLGPNKFSLLSSEEEKIESDTDLDLRSLVYLGWPVVRWVNRFFMIYLFDWMTGWGLNMGIVLLILTVFIKCLVFPLMKKSYLSSANMRVLRPKIEAATKQYTKPEDAMMKQQATMQLYSEYGVSPMGGCLPMLIQMPIWIALFNFIPNAIELRGQSFLWADDLSTYDDIINWGFNIWGVGDHLSLFCVLWCVSTVASSMISMRQQQDAMTPEQAQQMSMMKWMTYLMPIIFFFSFNSYSSGLNYYYFLSSLTSVLMMWYLRKSTDDAKLLAKLEERHRQRKMQQATGKKPSSMMQRLQAMQEKQMEILRQQQEAQRQREQQQK